MLNLKDNPPVKPTAISALGEIKGDWYVAHTKGRNEKAFAWDLVRKNVPHFLPMVEKVTFSGGRKRRNMAALFPGYVFFAGNGDTRLDAFSTNRLCQIIDVRDQVGLVSELSQIDIVLTTGHDVAYFPHAAVGKRVRVNGGPFEGSEGVVIEHQEADARETTDGLMVVLSVSILGVGAGIRVPPSLLAPADDLVPTIAIKGPKYERVEAPKRVLRGKQLPPETRGLLHREEPV